MSTIATPLRFTKKPVTIEAYQVGSSGFYPDWLRDAITANIVVTHSKPGSDAWSEPFDSAEIHTLEGVMTAECGDWIIQGVKGELYPCKPDIFAATYEPEAASHA